MKINKPYKIQGKYLDKINKSSDEREKNLSNAQNDKNISIEISKSTKKLVNKINKVKDQQFDERVERIRQLVVEGKYPISSEKIAERILQTIEEQKGSERSEN